MPRFKGHHASKSTTTTTGSRSKYGDHSLSRLKSTMFASMNKSEPSLAHPEGGRPACEISTSSRPPAVPNNLSPKLQLSSSSGKSTHSDMMEMPTRNLHSAYHPSFRFILNQTSRRISEFTSRLHGPSLPPTQTSAGSYPLLPDSLSLALKSPEIRNPPAIPDHSKLEAAPPSHHREELPVISQPSPSAENAQLPGKVKRSNARVHSPNFYQSLKSRWKPETIPAEDLTTIPTASLSGRDSPKMCSNFDSEPHPPELSASRSPIEGTECSSSGQSAAGAIGIRQDDFRPADPNPHSPHHSSVAILRPASTSRHKSDLASRLPLQSSDKKSGAFLVSEDSSTPPLPSNGLGTVHTSLSSHESPSLLTSGVKPPEANLLSSPFPLAFGPPAQLPPLPPTATKPADTRVQCNGTDIKAPLLPPTSNHPNPSLQNQTLKPNANEPPAPDLNPETYACRVNNGLQCSAVPSSSLTAVDHNQAPASEAPLPKAMPIADGLHHKRHLTFAARRSSISMVLKRQDSLSASTPILFQGIWEKELEENERKWKRLARMSGSQSSSRYSTESYVENENPSKRHSSRASLILGGPTRRSSSVTSEHLIRMGRSLSQHVTEDLPTTQHQGDVLDQVWDSFKSEAELSLSDINCDGLNLDNSSSCPRTRSSADSCQLHLPDLHQITFDTDLDRALAVRNSGSFAPADPDAKPIGLGLFHSCDSPIASNFPNQEEYSPISNAKLKKLSLLSNRTSLGTSGVMRDRRRRPERKVTPNATVSNRLEGNPTSLDSSLLDAFPAPPRSHRSSQSSSSSHSLQAIPSSGLQSKGQVELTSAHAPPAQKFDAANDRPSLKQTDIHTHDRHKPTMERWVKNPISFTLTSFSNRPRAQTSARSPVPPPLNLKATPSNSNPRRRTMTSHVGDQGKTGLETIPPVPFMPVPNTAPLACTTPMSYDRSKLATSAATSETSRPSFSNESKCSRVYTGGMTPKRPTLLIRPSLRSPHRVGVRMGPFRPGETVPSPRMNEAFSPAISSPTAQSSHHTIQQPANSLHNVTDQAGYFSSPHASAGSSTGTASSSSTVPSPATPTSSRMTYNSRIPSVPMSHMSGFPSGFKSSHSDNPRYVVIDQTPKYSGGPRATPDTIKASRIYRPELLKSTPLSEPTEQVSYGMAL
ncbi:hypothetical protein VP01_710g3 [Puccinia sorghi]|uniref:Uncharacterized protein n=1 Tax=Puccinia sorghi TaxID=27349 RepID=A0A0L6UDM7_9BASI|nr:hypothetical protein VP01_710g3 [Puccinia sorghi]